MKRIIAVCMLMVLIVSQTACTFSRNNDRAVIPGSSITPAPGAAKEIKGDGENPTLTGVLTLRDADTGRMRFVDIKTGTEYLYCLYKGLHILFLSLYRQYRYSGCLRKDKSSFYHGYGWNI